MCGIAGFSLSNESTANSKRLSKALLLGIEHRGQDATGFAFIDGTGRAQVHKAAMNASTFVRKNLCIPRSQRSAILHTRAWTTGQPSFNGNNHPIPSGNIVGVHNGWVSNAYDLWDFAVSSKFRQAAVDSEVIFAMLAHAEPGATTTELLGLLDGPAAVAWLDVDQPTKLFLSRVTSNPIHIAQTTCKSLVFASTVEAVIAGCREGGLEITHLRETAEGNLLTVVNGEVDNVDTFVVTPHSPRGRRNSYSWDDDYDFYDPKGTKITPKDDSAPSARVLQAAETFIGGEDEVTEPFYNEWLDRELFSPLYDPEHKSDKDYYETYETRREPSIDSWFQNYRGTGENCLKLAESMHTFIRPGDKVTTKIDDREYSGDVVHIPNSFPGGQYVLRITVPKLRQGFGEDPQKAMRTECILLERGWWEFTSQSADHRIGRGLSVSQNGEVEVRV